jgi:hypothetical protein
VLLIYRLRLCTANKNNYVEVFHILLQLVYLKKKIKLSKMIYVQFFGKGLAVVPLLISLDCSINSRSTQSLFFMFKINILPVFVKYSTLKKGNTSFASSWPRPLQFYQKMLENVQIMETMALVSPGQLAACIYIYQVLETMALLLLGERAARLYTGRWRNQKGKHNVVFTER